MAGKRVAVIGASGYGGLQTLRLLQDHPEFVVTFLGGERSSGKRWSELVPFLPLPHDLVVQSPDPAAIAAAADLAVLSLPNGLAAQLAPALLELGADVNCVDHDGNTPLHHAVELDHAPVRYIHICMYAELYI